MRRTAGTFSWTIASSVEELDQTRYLGELHMPPPANEREPGDWCDVVGDEHGELRWTLILVEEPVSLFAVPDRARAD